MTIKKFYHQIYNMAHKGVLRKSGVTVKNADAKIKNSRVVMCAGKENVIEIGERVYLDGCSFFFDGSGCRVTIGDGGTLYNVAFHLRDVGSNITVGKNVIIAGETQLAAIEGTSVEIGDDSLLADKITVRTGDSHIIYDEYGDRINNSESVKIGKHVWVGQGAILLKGIKISSGSIVGSGAVVTRKFEDSNIVIAGNPGRMVKKNVKWEF